MDDQDPSPELDCQTCGACCREAYDSTEVEPEDPFAHAHPELLQERMGALQLLRNGGWCACLTRVDGRFACTHYTVRPQTCRDFTRGSANCHDARRRVGLPVPTSLEHP